MKAFRIAGLAIVLLVSVPLEASAAPANDDRARATRIDTVPFEAEGSTVTATRERGEPRNFCGPIARTVWFKYTAPDTRPLAISTAGSAFDTILVVWHVTPSGLRHAECDNNSGTHLQSLVSFPTVAGDTYYIQLGGWSGERGRYRLRLTYGARAGGPIFVAGVAADPEYVEAEFFVGAFVGGVTATFNGGSVRVEDGSVEESRVCVSMGLIVGIDRCT